MDLRKWLKRGKKDPNEPGEGEPGRGMPPLPKWTKKDAFMPKEGDRPPPMANEASIKRPGQWLRSKLGIQKAGEKLQALEKTKGTEGDRGPSAPDQENLDFLEHYLEPPKPKEESPEAEKKASEAKAGAAPAKKE